MTIEKAEAQGQRLVLVTGPSGAGRSTAVNALEDLGYEPIDNLPLSLVPRLIDLDGPSTPIALGLDVRNRDFAASSLIELIDGLARDPRVTLDVLYLDCAPESAAESEISVRGAITFLASNTILREVFP